MGCNFSKQKYEIYEGCLRIVEHTNLAYVKPHKIIIENKLYLFFNDQKHFYVGNLKKIKFHCLNFLSKIREKGDYQEPPPPPPEPPPEEPPPDELPPLDESLDGLDDMPL